MRGTLDWLGLAGADDVPTSVGDFASGGRSGGMGTFREETRRFVQTMRNASYSTRGPAR